jgi:hypothetical protein
MHKIADTRDNRPWPTCSGKSSWRSATPAGIGCLGTLVEVLVGEREQ